MTRQPTIHVRFLFLMAFNAESHLKVPFFYPVHGFDVAMALLTGNLFFNVPFVIK